MIFIDCMAVVIIGYQGKGRLNGDQLKWKKLNFDKSYQDGGPIVHDRNWI